MRLIDVDELLEDLKARHDYVLADEAVSKNLKWYEAVCNCAVVKIVERQPTVDAVEVVRCKDCRHCDTSCGIYWCDRFDTATSYDGLAFCSYGKRKEPGNATDRC